MNNNLFMFGDGDMAEIAHYYFSNHSDFEVKVLLLTMNFRQRSLLWIKSFFY